MYISIESVCYRQFQLLYEKLANSPPRSPHSSPRWNVNSSFNSLTNSSTSYWHFHVSISPAFNYRLSSMHRNYRYFWWRCGADYYSSLVSWWFETILYWTLCWVTLNTVSTNYGTAPMNATNLLTRSNRFRDLRLVSSFIARLFPAFHLKRTNTQDLRLLESM